MRLSDYVIQEYKTNTHWEKELNLELEELFNWVVHHKDESYPDDLVYGSASLISKELYEEYCNLYKQKTTSDD